MDLQEAIEAFASRLDSCGLNHEQAKWIALGAMDIVRAVTDGYTADLAGMISEARFELMQEDKS